MGCEQIIEAFFSMALNIKLYHWQTKEYARHKASDELFQTLLGNMDSFIEIYIGKYGRPRFDRTVAIEVGEITDEYAKAILEEYVFFVKHEIPKYIKPTDSDLLTIRDAILGDLSKTLYLFSLS